MTGRDTVDLDALFPLTGEEPRAQVDPEPDGHVDLPAYIAYESEWATVWHGDAEEVLPTLDTESVHLVVADPPYGVKNQSRRRRQQFDVIDNDTQADRPLVRRILEQCVRVVGQHRHLYVFGPSDVLDGLKVSEVVQLIWDKQALGSGDVTSAWGPSHEPINFTVSKHRHAGKKGASAIPARLRKGSVLSFARPTGRKVRHPNEKPLRLCQELVESSSKVGELVLDPTCGSGSVGVAAILSGRRCILIESKRQWVDLTIERVKKAEAAVASVRDL